MVTKISISSIAPLSTKLFFVYFAIPVFEIKLSHRAKFKNGNTRVFRWAWE